MVHYSTFIANVPFFVLQIKHVDKCGANSGPDGHGKTHI